MAWPKLRPLTARSGSLSMTQLQGRKASRPHSDSASSTPSVKTQPRAVRVFSDLRERWLAFDVVKVGTGRDAQTRTVKTWSMRLRSESTLLTWADSLLEEGDIRRAPRVGDDEDGRGRCVEYSSGSGSAA